METYWLTNLIKENWYIPRTCCALIKFVGSSFFYIVETIWFHGKWQKISQLLGTTASRKFLPLASTSNIHLLTQNRIYADICGSNSVCVQLLPPLYLNHSLHSVDEARHRLSEPASATLELSASFWLGDGRRWDGSARTGSKRTGLLYLERCAARIGFPYSARGSGQLDVSEPARAA